MKTCVAYCIGDKFLTKDLSIFLDKNFTTIIYKNVTLIPHKQGKIIIFNFGTLVFWDLDIKTIDEFIYKLNDYVVGELTPPIIDEFSYSQGKEFSIKQDNLIIKFRDNNDEKIAISYVIAQSIKLSQFEESITYTINETVNIPKTIIKNGKISLSDKKISQLRGDLFLKKSNVNLQYELLDTPDFFWDFPELETYYHKTSNYLEIKNRVIALNKKLEIIHELFEMLSDEQKHNYSSKLEWIIIILILIEIVVSFVEKFVSIL